MKNAKEEKIAQYLDYIKDYRAGVEEAEKILSSLIDYDKNIIDKRFFEKYFPMSNEYRKWTRFNFYPPQYSFETFYKTIQLTGRERVEVKSNKRAQIIQDVRDYINGKNALIKEHKTTIKTLEAIDQDQLEKDLIAVYHKHGKPTIWGQVLESYNVKYPNK